MVRGARSLAAVVWVVVVSLVSSSIVQRVQCRSGPSSISSSSSGELEFVQSPHHVTLSNSMVDVSIGNDGARGGSIQSLIFKRQGMPDLELLDMDQKCGQRGYWDMHWEYGSYVSGQDYNLKCRFGENDGASWSTFDGKGSGAAETMLGITFKHEKSGPSSHKRHEQPVNSKVHYAVREGVAGTYCSLLVDHTPNQPAIQLSELRLVLKLDPNLFDYSYVADDRQRYMPTRLDISRHHSQRLWFKEARKITKPQNMSFLGEVDHKYQYSVEAKDGALHGWISTKLRIGVWIISPNKWEYLGGGPFKQDLTVQTGPNLLAMLHSCHYGTPAIPLEGSEKWKKAYGPFLVYVNEARDIKDLIEDAKARAAEEIKSWPYHWVPFKEYRKPDGRGTVTGRVVKLDPFQTQPTAAPVTWLGLTDERSPISNWEDEVKSYQFWNHTNEEGEFTIYNVNPGTYLLQTMVRGFLLDSSVLQTVTVKAGWVSNVGEVVLRAKQKGSTVWEIGEPDRSAAEFFIPDLDRSGTESANLKDGFRHYGVWNKFEELYPEKDPVYVVGESNWEKDWFFAHVNRNNTPTQREIRFDLENIIEGDYTLRLAIAGAHQAALEVRLNNPMGSPLHDTGAFGRDNALARAGIHGHYHEFSISLSHMNFRVGCNSIFLRQRKALNKLSYVMYDYIRLESPAVQSVQTS